MHRPSNLLHPIKWSPYPLLLQIFLVFTASLNLPTPFLLFSTFQALNSLLIYSHGCCSQCCSVSPFLQVLFSSCQNIHYFHRKNQFQQGLILTWCFSLFFTSRKFISRYGSCFSSCVFLCSSHVLWYFVPSCPSQLGIFSRNFLVAVLFLNYSTRLQFGNCLITCAVLFSFVVS